MLLLLEWLEVEGWFHRRQLGQLVLGQQRLEDRKLDRPQLRRHLQRLLGRLRQRELLPG